MHKTVSSRCVSHAQDKAVYYECTWFACKEVIPESDDRIQKQKNRQDPPYYITCPVCGKAMQRRVH